MDAIRAKLDVLSPETSEDTSTTVSNPKAVIDKVLAARLVRESSEFEEYRCDKSPAGSEDTTISLPKDCALCIEFERTVEDESLWQSSFSSRGTIESTAGGEKTQSRTSENKGKEVLLIWPEIDSADQSSDSENDEEPRLSVFESVLEHHPSLAELLDLSATADGIAVQISLVRPPVLTKVILHRIPSETASSQDDVVDDAEEAKEVLEELAGKQEKTLNDAEEPGTPVIVHQNTHWMSAKGRTYIVLLALPFTQGVISTSSTEVIISSTPNIAPTSHQNGISSEHSGPNPVLDRLAFSATLQHRNVALSGMARSSTTRSTRQQRAMMNFSADGFLSASLAVDPARERKEAGRRKRAEMRGMMSSVGLDELEEEEDEAEDPFWDDELDDDHSTLEDDEEEEEEDTDVVLGLRTVSSLSESSGSITPRPRSFVDPPDHYSPRQTSPDGDIAIEHSAKPLQNGHMNGAVVYTTGSVGAQDYGDNQGNTDEQDTFRGFAFEPFALCRRPLSASTRFHERSVKSVNKGKGKGKMLKGEDDGHADDAKWPDDQTVVWLTLKGLARAGLFIGDWVLLCYGEAEHDSGERLVQVDVIEDFDPEAEDQLVNKQYEKQFTEGLRQFFESDVGSNGKRVVRQGDVIAVPICTATSDEDGEMSLLRRKPRYVESTLYGFEVKANMRPIARRPDNLVYFVITNITYEPLVPLEQDFASSVSSKARGGELGCWIDVDKTRMISIGVQRGAGYAGTKAWWGILPVLLSGARGSGKTSLVSYVAEELGVHLVDVDGYTLLADSDVKTQGAFQAALEKATECAPSIFLLRHLEAVGRKDNNPGSRKEKLRDAAVASGCPTIFIATTSEPEDVASELLTVFKQDVQIKAPSESERLDILTQAVGRSALSPDVDLRYIAAQTAALQAIDLANLVDQARYLAVSQCAAVRLGVTISMDDFDQALRDARTSLADSIGAPKIPNVSWDDVGGLSEVKADILDTIQLPLERPELFANGLKKRSGIESRGILLYGPPGTGKTLLAKAVATSCSLNFFSVKGPELLNMYIGESEANVRRVFQRARDAQPCVIFMDELDSVAPKRGNQGDSGGVMDRIVSQLLAELDGMSDGSGGAGVFVMAATNRPDLLDPALLRPGRFDRMLYLSVSQDHDTQCKIMQALTRKFKLHPNLDLRNIAEQCPFNYTGADFYALCSDAMLKAMSRTAAEVDRKIDVLNAQAPPYHHPHPLTPRYYLSEMASPAELEVVVQAEDFKAALKDLVPSVSAEEMAHYAQVQKQFSKVTMNSKQGNENGAPVASNMQLNGKGKGKAKLTDGEI
ncbi:hypothetical protein QFC21_002126 [Naganishia friedmannii]|uniref:Uncharacterized protein n=1 Tax=Naganishia friedmannii TaxID=89922 RepID=A0ACC2VZS5_9TREE|nr:hypothetical protein QFC21_002126 [Naganishia friedmannii]